ncbi:MAG: DUF3160 domain-containing protein [Candidatus Moranbacteria bacterium]|nr:DUF3160 domain-containing protein [Candidatus Moranbacteria bacterium]
MENQNQPVSDRRRKVLVVSLIAGASMSVLAIMAFIVWRQIVSAPMIGQAGIPGSRQSSDAFSIPADIGVTSSKYSFPKFGYVKSEYTPAVPDVPIALSELKNLDSFPRLEVGDSPQALVSFTDAQKQALVKENFFVARNTDRFFGDDPKADTSRKDDWTDQYDRIGGVWDPLYRRPENSVFVTSDFLLHVYHRLLDKEFKYIEQTEFYPRLKKITGAMFTASLQAYNGATDPGEKDSYRRLVTYFAVPSAILDSATSYSEGATFIDDGSDSKESVLANLEKMKGVLPAEAYDTAKGEVELIMGADQVQDSPLFGKYLKQAGITFPEDYTQYGPRSHYGENPVLRSYWRTMMWYGRQNFIARSPELTRDAMNVVLFMSHSDQMKNWEDIYAATSFFVGESDDLGLGEYGKVMTENRDIPIGERLVAKLQQDIDALPNPKIMSSVAIGGQVSDTSKEDLQKMTKGFRFMGQRFTPDAFIFSSLTQGDEKPDPKTGQSLPSSPTALEVASILGNGAADKPLNDWISANAPDSKNVLSDRMSALKSYFGGLSQDAWTQNIYWGWLYTLRSLSQQGTDLAGYPNFMKGDAWGKKNLQCTLGSWTELKHDTLLYSKQSYAEMGGGGGEGEIPPVPKGYVEPNVEFFDRIIPLVRMTASGLQERGLLDQEFQGRNEKLITSLEFFRRIAISEVNNQTISDDDFETLRTATGSLSWVVYPLPGEQGTEDLARAALIADVHTDVPKNRILYEADGIPNYIYVAVKDANGTRLTKGLVYSNYEFFDTLGKRLTDSDWKERAYSGDESRLPAVAEWNKSLFK